MNEIRMRRVLKKTLEQKVLYIKNKAPWIES